MFKNLSNENKIVQFFECYEINKNVDKKDLIFFDNIFLDYEDDNGFNSSDEEE